MDGLPSSYRDPSAESDTLQDRRHVASILGILLGCVVYVAAHRIGHPLFLYLPHTEAWVLDAPADAVSMGYYGSLAYGCIGFVLGWGLGRLPVVSAWVGSRDARGLTTLATFAVAGALLYHLAVELM